MITLAVAEFPSPEIVAVALVYPLPWFVILIAVTAPPLTVAFAVAPVPSPSIVTVAEVYPDPPAVTKIVAIEPSTAAV